MPTNRRKRTRKRRESAIPAWATRFLETGEEPVESEDPEAHDQFLGWYFLGESVPGLPAADEIARRRK